MNKILALFIMSTMLTGCSMFLLRDQPDYVHVKDVQPGVKKAVALGTFGSPTLSYTNSNGESCDIFKFKQGYTSAEKHSRLFLHSTADLLTLGLWEAVGTPLEVALDGKDLSYEVCYDKDNIITSVTQISEDGKVIPPTPDLTSPEEKIDSKQ